MTAVLAPPQIRGGRCRAELFEDSRCDDLVEKTIECCAAEAIAHGDDYGRAQ